MNLFVVLIVVVIMLIAAVSYAKGQRTKRKAAEAYVKDLQRDLASMAEHNQELQKINRENSEKLAELVATPDTDLVDRANDLFPGDLQPAHKDPGIDDKEVSREKDSHIPADRANALFSGVVPDDQ